MNFRIENEFEYDRFELSPFVNLRVKSSRFNDYYFGLDREDVGSGIDFSLGLEGKIHVWKNLYLLGKAQSTWLGKENRDLLYIDGGRVEEFYLGVALMNDRKKQKKKSLSITPYFRVSHGWATPSDLNKIISGDSEKDEYNNQLTSFFYGHPLTDELFGLPLEIYLTPGFIWHWKSEVQSSSREYVLAVKAYYTFKWPIRWRFGFAEGFSYASDIPYVEASEMERKGYEPSSLMNYLDFSLDLNLGDLFQYIPLKKIYFGYAIHHRSAIFESSAHFGRVSGGSNYHTLYLQYHF